MFVVPCTDACIFEGTLTSSNLSNCLWRGKRLPEGGFKGARWMGCSISSSGEGTAAQSPVSVKLCQLRPMAVNTAGNFSG